ncbi:MAG: MBOAT family protein [Gammaproteobacteria bacterium]|nr:MBOAT family protein [Gammaproteobacteria bacterium]
MLFHSQLFLLCFAPLALAAWYAFDREYAVRRALMIAASLLFYGYWDPRLVPLLVLSVVLNWGIARLFHALNDPGREQGAAPPAAPGPRPGGVVAGVGAHAAGPGPATARTRFVRSAHTWLPALGVAINLALLGWFKYADFIGASLAAAFGNPYTPLEVVLPLAISFFTFQQISYLVDIRRGEVAPYSLADYALYVCYFPQLIAGPIVRHNEIIAQFRLAPRRPGFEQRLARGLGLLCIGLVKKVFIADELAKLCDPLFARTQAGDVLSLAEAWAATAGFGMQLYYDFSAYSDMALGLGLMCGLVLPANFDSPYLASSLRQFWRRWHMTLSRFLRDYLYIPLGGSRQGLPAVLAALLVTMLLGGLWHGAAWTFVAWGAVHGVGLCVNHLWARAGLRLPTVLGWTLTLIFVLLAWVLFRAESFASAALMYQSLAGLGAQVSDGGYREDLWVLWPALAIALLAPTSQRFALDLMPPNRALAAFAGLSMFVILLTVGDWRHVEFIYFQF